MNINDEDSKRMVVSEAGVRSLLRAALQTHDPARLVGWLSQEAAKLDFVQAATELASVAQALRVAAQSGTSVTESADGRTYQLPDALRMQLRMQLDQEQKRREGG